MGTTTNESDLTLFVFHPVAPGVIRRLRHSPVAIPMAGHVVQVVVFRLFNDAIAIPAFAGELLACGTFKPFNSSAHSKLVDRHA